MIVTFREAVRILESIGVYHLSYEQLEDLNGYLPALAEAVAMGSLPSLFAFKQFIGLAVLPTVISDGRTGADFISTLSEKRHFHWSTRGILESEEFDSSVTEGVEYKPAVIRGSEFSNNSRTTRKICEEATRRNYVAPPPELALLLGDVLAAEEIQKMSLLRLVVMHDPIMNSEGKDCILGWRCEDRRRDGLYDLYAYESGSPDRLWDHSMGFVFLMQTAES